MEVMTKLLYVGDLNKNSTSLARAKVLENKFTHFSSINSRSKYEFNSFLLRRLFHYFKKIKGSKSLCVKILSELEKGEYKYLWLDKASYITGDFIQSVKQMNVHIIHYTQDHIGSYNHGFSYEYFSSLSEIDIQITTNRSDYAFYENFGRRVYLDKFSYSYDPKPFETPLLKRYDVVFIGHHEEYTEGILRLLAKDYKITVFGPKWIKLKHICNVMPYTVWGDDYIEEIRKSKIVLSIFSKYNLNTNTLRPYEITSSGSFVLTERTKDILKDFNEGNELECFGSIDELKKKISYYLIHENERELIAKQGMKKTIDHFSIKKVFGSTVDSIPFDDL